MEELPLRALMEVLLGPVGKRKLKLRSLPNVQLLRLHDSELVVRLHNAKKLQDTSAVLERFGAFLASYPLSAELAKAFLAQYARRKPRTLYRYA